MNEAAKILFDYNDFSSFEKLHSDNKTSRCKIFEAKWYEDEKKNIFIITADRFLRNMVRSIVGTMLEIGQGKISAEKFRNIIEAKNRNSSGASVAASGLFLTDIVYPEPINSKLNFTRKIANQT
jgi:tRNA pseudouridine38-40 synthase